ncbi:MAG: hypothetical protein EYC68_22215 [Chloroflexota bacterium]|nr:MAG: hypothetical protein EYC68_22215 [Chloroflexota bacterium]
MICQNCTQETAPGSDYCGRCGFPQRLAGNNQSQWDEWKKLLEQGAPNLSERASDFSIVGSDRIWHPSPTFRAESYQIWQYDKEAEEGFIPPAKPNRNLGRPILAIASVILFGVLLIYIFTSGITARFGELINNGLGEFGNQTQIGTPTSTPLPQSATLPNLTPIIITRAVTVVVPQAIGSPAIVTRDVTVVVPQSTLTTAIIDRPVTVIVNAPTPPPQIVEITSTTVPTILPTRRPVRRPDKFGQVTLLSPQFGAKFPDPGQAISLSWESIGRLDNDEFYKVQVGTDANFGNGYVACSFFTRETTARLPGAQQAPCGPLWKYANIYFWRVYVVSNGVDGEYIESPYSQIFQFGWNP